MRTHERDIERAYPEPPPVPHLLPQTGGQKIPPLKFQPNRWKSNDSEVKRQMAFCLIWRAVFRPSQSERLVYLKISKEYFEID